MADKPSKMIEIQARHRRLNTERVAHIKLTSKAMRFERDRPSDLPLIQVCLKSDPPEHVRQVHPGIFSVDLPADVFKAVWFVDGGFVVGTYHNRLDRAEDL